MTSGTARDGFATDGDYTCVRRFGAAAPHAACVIRTDGARVVESLPHVFLFLSDGRLFIRGADGDIEEADAWDRKHAVFLLGVEEAAKVDPLHGLELSPPGQS